MWAAAKIPPLPTALEARACVHHGRGQGPGPHAQHTARRAGPAGWDPGPQAAGSTRTQARGVGSGPPGCGMGPRPRAAGWDPDLSPQGGTRAPGCGVGPGPPGLQGGTRTLGCGVGPGPGLPRPPNTPPVWWHHGR